MENKQPLRVTLVCNSDLMGGAGVVTYRLMRGLRNAGVDARLIVYTRLSDNDENVDLIGTRFLRGWVFMKERLKIFLANGFNRENLFKVSIADEGFALHRHPWVKGADVIALNWINQGLLSLDGVIKIARLGKPIVWTMHDMWNLTGICHHAHSCTGYLKECGACPLLKGHGNKDLSHRVWLRKRRLYATTPIKFVAVSNWLARKCAESSLMRECDITVIPNSFPTSSFHTSVSTPPSWKVEYKRNVIVMGAARLDDPIKGLPIAIQALNIIFNARPDIANSTMVVFFGDIRDASILDSLNISHVHLGRINDPRQLREIYAASNIVLSTSLYETLPGTLIEGQAAGCIPVSFGKGGQSDIIDHKVTGYIAEYKNPQSVADGIIWAIEHPVDRKTLHKSVMEKFDEKIVVQRYIELFNSLTGKA